MPLLSSTILLRTLSLYHLTLSYYLLTTPRLLTTHSLVSILGASMSIPPAVPTRTLATSAASSILTTPNAGTGLLALVFAYTAVSDLAAAGLRADVFHEFWGLQAPLRMAFFLGLEAWVYLGSKMAGDGQGMVMGKTSGVDWLRNDVVFTWGFVEMVWLFWVSLVLSLISCASKVLVGLARLMDVRRQKHMLTWSGTDLQHVTRRAPATSHGCCQERGAVAGPASLK